MNEKVWGERFRDTQVASSWHFPVWNMAGAGSVEKSWEVSIKPRDPKSFWSRLDLIFSLPSRDRMIENPCWRDCFRKELISTANTFLGQILWSLNFQCCLYCKYTVFIDCFDKTHWYAVINLIHPESEVKLMKFQQPNPESSSLEPLINK